MNGLHLDNFVKSKSETISHISAHAYDNCSFIDTKGHTLPVQENPLIEDFDFENEVEVELDVLPSIEILPYYFSFKTLSNVFLNVYSTYSFVTDKVEFLDIFSPPPNC